MVFLQLLTSLLFPLKLSPVLLFSLPYQHFQLPFSCPHILPLTCSKGHLFAFGMALMSVVTYGLLAQCSTETYVLIVGLPGHGHERPLSLTALYLIEHLFLTACCKSVVGFFLI